MNLQQSGNLPCSLTKKYMAPNRDSSNVLRHNYKRQRDGSQMSQSILEPSNSSNRVGGKGEI